MRENNIAKFLKYFFKKKKSSLKKKILSGKIAGKKIHASSAATLTITSDSDKKTKINEQNIEQLLEKYLDNPNELFKYIENAKTAVYKIKNADKILAFIKEQEGFILPQTGFKAFYLNLILNKKLSLNTQEMFVLRSFDVNSYAISYQFYNWYCYKMKIEGFETSVQKKFKNIFEICETDKINELDFEEILELKSAIKRDIEAINFVKKMAQKKSMAKKNFNKIKQGKAIGI